MEIQTSCNLLSIVHLASQGHGHGGGSACRNFVRVGMLEAWTTSHRSMHDTKCSHHPSSNIEHHIAQEVVNSHRVPTQQPSNRIATRR
jgi:hypothetical protein